jgi:predicted DNA-binding WGR domain protein
MSEWTVHLEFEEGTSSKFWRARVEGKTLYVNYGKIGSAGQTQVKDLADPAAAKREYDKLVAEKRKKGYADAGAGGGGAEADADDVDTVAAARDDDDAGGGDDGGDDDDDDDRPARKPAGKRAPAAAPPGRAAAPAGKAAAVPSAPGHRLVLDAGGRKVETTLYLDGASLRMDSRETYATAEAASKAFERLNKLLVGEGYKAG